jgi:hypothetical protein
MQRLFGNYLNHLLPGNKYCYSVKVLLFCLHSATVRTNKLHPALLSSSDKHLKCLKPLFKLYKTYIFALSIKEIFFFRF